jgi:hypothetical protein
MYLTRICEIKYELLRCRCHYLQKNRLSCDEVTVTTFILLLEKDLPLLILVTFCGSFF